MVSSSVRDFIHLKMVNGLRGRLGAEYLAGMREDLCLVFGITGERKVSVKMGGRMAMVG